MENDTSAKDGIGATSDWVRPYLPRVIGVLILAITALVWVQLERLDKARADFTERLARLEEKVNAHAGTLKTIETLVRKNGVLVTQLWAEEQKEAELREALGVMDFWMKPPVQGTPKGP